MHCPGARIMHSVECEKRRHAGLQMQAVCLQPGQQGRLAHAARMRALSFAVMHAGSPFAAYAEALPEDAVSLVQVKAWEAASLTKSLSEGTAQVQPSAFHPLG